MKEFSELYRLYSGKIILGGVKMKIKKFSTKKVIYAIILLVILLSIGFIGNAFNGNPVSKYFAKNEYKEYVKETYPNTDFEVSEAFYNFKDGKYGARIVSESKGLNFRIDRRYNDVINDEYRDDELINIAYEIKEVIINSGYKGLSVICFEFVDENYNYEYILLEKENFNTSKDGLMNFKAKDASIFYKTEDDDEIVNLGIDVK